MLRGHSPGGRAWGQGCGDWPVQAGIRYSASAQSAAGIAATSGARGRGLSLRWGGGLTRPCPPPHSNRSPSNPPLPYPAKVSLTIPSLASVLVLPSHPWQRVRMWPLAVFFPPGTQQSPEPQVKGLCACLANVDRQQPWSGVSRCSPASCLETGTCLGPPEQKHHAPRKGIMGHSPALPCPNCVTVGK